MKIYGYARISTAKQSIDRQIRNILSEYPDAIIVKEVFTGTKFQGRKEFEKLLNVVKADDCIVFDSVSRFSRDADEGFELYELLFDRGITLIFLKEPHINTDTYKKAMANQIGMTGDKVDFILQGINHYLMELAKEQIRIAFEQSEKEVKDLRQRTKEGIETARLNGKQIGRQTGKIYKSKRAEKAKEEIKKYNKTFGGPLNDKDTMLIVGVSRRSFYKYKKELIE